MPLQPKQIKRSSGGVPSMNKMEYSGGLPSLKIPSNDAEGME